MIFKLLSLFDWISPSVEIGSEVAEQLDKIKPEKKKSEDRKTTSFYETHGYRKWVWVNCSENQKSCRGKPTCSDCYRCEDHCICGVTQETHPPKFSDERIASFPSDKEWMCRYCDTPNPRQHRKCDSCGAPRPFV